MTEPEYLARAEAVLTAIEHSCDRINEETDVDLDNQRTGNMLTICFSDESQLIVNLQKPLQEIWLAARSGGYHYHYDGSAWIDTRTGAELFAMLSREASAYAGRPLRFEPEQS